MYYPTFPETWFELFEKLEIELKDRISKKIRKILEFPQKRHLRKGLDYFVDQAGQYRIVYQVIEEQNEIRFFFVGNHKEYEKWFKRFF